MAHPLPYPLGQGLAYLSLKGAILLENRFEKIYSQGVLSVMEIWLDKATGVQYLYRENGTSGGMCPLLGRDGQPLLIDQQNFTI